MVAQQLSEAKRLGVPVNHLTELRELDVSSTSGIDQKGIDGLRKLIKIDASNNRTITNLNHLSNLRELYCAYNSGIDQNGIDQLRKIVILDCCDKVMNVNHLSELRELYCGIHTKKDLICKNLKIIYYY